MIVHATCVAIDQRAVLLLGGAGSGKSDVALRLIETGAILVSDDQTLLTNQSGVVTASPPPHIAGMIEARHAGLIKGLPFIEHVPVHLAVELFADAAILERLPEPFFHSFLDQPVRGLKLAAFEGSTPMKIRLTLQGLLYDG